MRTVAGKNMLLYSPTISMHIYKPKTLNEGNLCGLRDFTKREESDFNSKESSSRELKERVLV